MEQEVSIERINARHRDSVEKFEEGIPSHRDGASMRSDYAKASKERSITVIR